MPMPRRTSVAPPSSPPIRHEDCWAKTTPSGQPGISVAQHSRTAGIVAGLLALQCPAWLSQLLAIRTGIILAALHDIGKVSPGFQKKCAVWVTQHGLDAAQFAGMEEDHAKISQKALQDLLADDDLRFWAAIVGAHHGRLKGDRLPPLCDGGEHWEIERRRLAEELIREFGPLPKRAPCMLPDGGDLWFNAGLIAVADWLASDERAFPPSQVLDSAALRERAEGQLARIGFRPAVCLAGKTFRDLFSFQPNAMQQVFAGAVGRPGVYVVEAAMGLGKTEAALMAAYKLLAGGQATGIYFALPTQVTSNRIHRRVAAFVDRIAPGAGARLIHGNSWLMETEQPLTDSGNGSVREGTGRDWFASSRRALLAPFGVGTVDQALLGVVAAKHFFVRQFGLAGKVVILDEVHSYDLYTGTLLDRLVCQLRELGATVIILSATLTAARRRELLGLKGNVANDLGAAYPLVSAGFDGEFRQWPVEPEPSKTVQVRFQKEGELADACLERAQGGECVLWIRNTVNDAQETYRQLCGRNYVGGPELALLHARFPQFRREELENDWLDRLGKDQARRPRNGCVLVATQVAEQSVDIDADLLITDLAPTDMLLQRLGRLWRHHRPRPPGCGAPEVWIAAPALGIEELRNADVSEIKAAFGKSARVYAPYVLLRTYALWRDRVELTLPVDVRPLLEATYTEPLEDEPVAWRELREELEVRKKALRQSAISNSNPWQIALDDEEGVQTRWNSRPTVALLPTRRTLAWDSRKGATLELLNGDRCECRADEFNFETAKAIHRNLVKVPRWCVRAHLGRKPDWLREYVRDDILICKLDAGSLMLLPGAGASGLSYRNDLGVVIPPWQRISAGRARDAEEDDNESYD